MGCSGQTAKMGFETNLFKRPSAVAHTGDNHEQSMEKSGTRRKNYVQDMCFMAILSSEFCLQNARYSTYLILSRHSDRAAAKSNWLAWRNSEMPSFFFFGWPMGTLSGSRSVFPAALLAPVLIEAR